MVTSTDRLYLHDGLLTIKSVSQNDKGEFICEAANAIGNITRSVSVTLTGNQATISYRCHREAF